MPTYGGFDLELRSPRPLLPRNWWALAVRGAAALVFGILALLWPGVTLVTLALLLAGYFLVDGAFAIVAAVRATQRHERSWPFIVEGAASIAAGLLVALWPDMTVLLLVYLLAIWAIFTGVVMLFAGSAVAAGTPRWLLLLAGALSVLLGVLMISRPEAGVVAVAWSIGAYAVLFGALLLTVALWLRDRSRRGA